MPNLATSKGVSARTESRKPLIHTSLLVRMPLLVHQQ